MRHGFRERFSRNVSNEKNTLDEINNEINTMTQKAVFSPVSLHDQVGIDVASRVPHWQLSEQHPYMS